MQRPRIHPPKDVDTPELASELSESTPGEIGQPKDFANRPLQGCQTSPQCGRGSHPRSSPLGSADEPPDQPGWPPLYLHPSELCIWEGHRVRAWFSEIMRAMELL